MYKKVWKRTSREVDEKYLYVTMCLFYNQYRPPLGRQTKREKFLLDIRIPNRMIQGQTHFKIAYSVSSINQMWRFRKSLLTSWRQRICHFWRIPFMKTVLKDAVLYKGRFNLESHLSTGKKVFAKMVHTELVIRRFVWLTLHHPNFPSILEKTAVICLVNKKDAFINTRFPNL